jgi:hypothetical protein
LSWRIEIGLWVLPGVGKNTKLGEERKGTYASVGPVLDWTGVEAASEQLARMVEVALYGSVEGSEEVEFEHIAYICGVGVRAECQAGLTSVDDDCLCECGGGYSRKKCN